MTERLIEGLPDDTQKLLQTYVKEVKGVFGEQLEGMLLYGSAVRGEFLPGRSNLNILLLVSSYDSAVLKQVQCVAPSMEQGTDCGPALSDGRGAAHVGSGIPT